MNQVAAGQKVTRAGISRARRREAVTGILWASPWLVGFLLFTLGPVISSLYLSFNSYSIGSIPTWIGLDNYVKAISGQDILFWGSVVHTFHYALVMVPVGLA